MNSIRIEDAAPVINPSHLDDCHAAWGVLMCYRRFDLYPMTISSPLSRLSAPKDAARLSRNPQFKPIVKLMPILYPCHSARSQLVITFIIAIEQITTTPCKWRQRSSLCSLIRSGSMQNSIEFKYNPCGSVHLQLAVLHDGHNLYAQSMRLF
jgi:hypothetical protein